MGAKSNGHLWTPEQRLNDLPDDSVRDYFVLEAGILYQSLKKHKRVLGLAPAPEPQHQGHKIHILVEPSIEWYGQLWWRHAYGTNTNRGYWKDKGWIANNGKRDVIPKKRRSVTRIQGRIQRGRCLKALERLVKLEDRPTVWRKISQGGEGDRNAYDTLFRDFVLERLTEGYTEQNQDVHPELVVCDYFGVEVDPELRKMLEKMSYNQTVDLSEVPF